MASTIISSGAPYGGMTNTTTSRLVNLNMTIERLKEAIATASANYDGVPGTEFESGTSGPGPAPTNLFGVTPDPANPGQQGQAYAYAMGRLAEEWASFWAAASPFIEQLDNGSQTM